ncbi:LysR family transcriptional regulator [Paenarthrobacter sp. YAF11_1]|uniref:LysR family transcriptional regulator n=1 Tax=Paenarthrobacter sp. YAF11_1 TaxID=3233074 RepID=UPI003F974FA1
MDLKELETFRAVAELGSLTKASGRLHTAQPALSRQIKLLEAELRTSLFVRDGRGMRLTPAGEMLFERTRGLQRDVDRLRDDMRSFSGSPSGRVHLGLVPTVSAQVAGTVARRVLTELPGVSLVMSESYTGHLIDWLHRGQLDLSVLYGPSGSLPMPTESFGNEELVAITARGGHLANLEEIELTALLSKPLALPSPSHGLRRIIADAAERANAPMNVVIEADSFRLLLEIAAQGLGITVLPISAARSEVEAGILELTRIIHPTLHREVVMAWPGNETPSIAATAVSAILRDEVAKIFTKTLESQIK